jgi:hypothetical protein
MLTVFFTLQGLTQRDATLLVQFDSDGDGTSDRQRLVDLRDYGAGPGRDVTLPTLTLGRNAVVSGKVLRGDVTTGSGHRQTTVFVPQGPFSVQSGDDGSFVLDQMPEGTVTLAFFRGGYRPTAETKGAICASLFATPGPTPAGLTPVSYP